MTLQIVRHTITKRHLKIVMSEEKQIDWESEINSSELWLDTLSVTKYSPDAIKKKEEITRLMECRVTKRPTDLLKNLDLQTRVWLNKAKPDPTTAESDEGWVCGVYSNWPASYGLQVCLQLMYQRDGKPTEFNWSRMLIRLSGTP